MGGLRDLPTISRIVLSQPANSNTPEPQLLWETLSRGVLQLSLRWCKRDDWIAHLECIGPPRVQGVYLESGHFYDSFLGISLPLDRARWILPSSPVDPSSQLLIVAKLPTCSEVTPLWASPWPVGCPFMSPDVNICTGPSRIKGQHPMVWKNRSLQRSEIHLPLSSTSN